MLERKNVEKVPWDYSYRWETIDHFDCSLELVYNITFHKSFIFSNIFRMHAFPPPQIHPFRNEKIHARFEFRSCCYRFQDEYEYEKEFFREALTKSLIAEGGWYDNSSVNFDFFWKSKNFIFLRSIFVNKEGSLAGDSYRCNLCTAFARIWFVGPVYIFWNKQLLIFIDIAKNTLYNHPVKDKSVS